MFDVPMRILAFGPDADLPDGDPVWAHVVCPKGPMLPVAYPVTIRGTDYVGIVVRELGPDEWASYSVDPVYEVVLELRLDPEG